MWRKKLLFLSSLIGVIASFFLVCLFVGPPGKPDNMNMVVAGMVLFVLGIIGLVFSFD